MKTLKQFRAFMGQFDKVDLVLFIIAAIGFTVLFWGFIWCILAIAGGK